MSTAPSRIALGLQYDGTCYHGWQTQDDPELPTLQQTLERAVAQVANHPVSVVAAGRTDAGVHATGQVVHFDAVAERTPYSWVFGINSNLPRDLSVRWAKPVSTDFHARFVAVSRSYRYIIYNSPIRPALLRHEITWHHHPLDEKSMNHAAQFLMGQHDFSAFRGIHCQAKSPTRTISKIEVYRLRDFVVIEVQADGFLHHMVRNIAGVLLPIGAGQKSAYWTLEVLESRKRTQAGITAPAQGLYLVDVGYPARFDIPALPLGPFFL